MKKSTIHDVADAAGVSVATVDRVLNNRSGVRAPTREKVHSAILKLNYKPNRFAAQLAKARTYRFLFIVRVGLNTFMEQLCEQLKIQGQKLRQENVFVETRLVDSFDGKAAIKVLDSISPDEWDGVGVVVPDLPLVRQAVDSCVARGVKVVTVVSDLPSSLRDCFVGIDNTSAGRVAGRLLGRFSCGKRGKLGIIVASLSLRDHMERHMGCVQVVCSDFENLYVRAPLEGRDNAEDTFAAVDALLGGKEGKEIVALYSTGAANQGLIEALEKHKRKDIVTISHEITPWSRKALLDGYFDAILVQDVEVEVARSIMLLRQLCDGCLVDRNDFINTSILLPDNLP